jgi:hypothetical protein
VRPSATSAAAPGSPSLPAGPIVGIDNATLSADGRSLDVTVLGPYPMSDDKPCGADFALTSDVAGNVVNVTATEIASREGDCSLTELICCEHHLTASLPDGNTVDTVHDRGGMIPNRNLFVKRPAGLYDLNGLPLGWELRDEWPEWNGNWMRLYLRRGDPDPRETHEFSAHTLTFGTTYGGRITTEPEYLQPPVTVQGQPAQYERYEGDNPQIQLQWMADTQKLWLEAFEPDFTIDDLLNLANSATTG